MASPRSTRLKDFGRSIRTAAGSVRRHSAAAAHAIGAACAALSDEIGLALGVVLLAIGFWQTWRPGAFFVAGAVVLWVVLPARAPFLVRPPDGGKTKARKAE